MRNFFLAISFLCILWHSDVYSQTKTDYTQSRILILLDESSSMLDTWNNSLPKYKIADTFIMKLMDSIYAVNNQVEFSLRVFGHQHTVQENDCHDTRNEVPYSRDNRAQMTYRLSDIHPLGVTPLAYSLMQAAESDLKDEIHNAYSIVLITDGGESCGGDICDVMKTLVKHKIYFKPYIVSLEDYPELKNDYACMGNYLQVTHPADIPKALTTIVDAYRPMLNMTKNDYIEIQHIAATRKNMDVSDYNFIKDNKKTFKKEPIPDVHVSKKNVDTVANPVIVKKGHGIIVGEAPDRPEPIKIIALKKAALAPIFTTQPAFAKLRIRPLPNMPELKGELPEKPAPVYITKLRHGPLAEIAIGTKEKIKFARSFHPAMPELKGELPERPTPVTIKKLNTIPVNGIETPIAGKIKFKKVSVPKMPELKGELPEKPAPVLINKQQHLPMTYIAITIRPKDKMDKVNVPKIPVFTFVDEVIMPPKLVMTRLKHIAQKPYLTLWSADKYLPKQKMPALEIFKTLLNPNKGPATIKRKEMDSKTGGYDVQHEDAKETSLAVYFTNGHGKYFATTPMISLVEPISNKTMKKFFRTVDASGNPDAQTDMPTGKFDLVIKNLVIHDVDIYPNKKNKVIVIVKQANLVFEYAGAPTRPVKEFAAQVTERNVANGKITTQRCIDKVEYDPGNYHIVVNTVPEMIFNVDLDFDEEKPLVIYQPGFAKFTTDLNLSGISLYVQQGDKFLNFYNINMNDPNKNHLQLQPGIYQAHYRKGPGNFSTNEKVIPFTIMSNEDTEVILK